MAQISYGTITITDTTDINKIENWYLATDLSSGVTRNTSGWTTNIQSMTSTNQYLWNYEKIYGTGLNNTDVLISQTEPVIIGRYGQNGTNGTNGVDGNSITSIDEYYKITNSSTVTSTNPGSTGWTKNGLVVPTNENKYLWNYEVINYSKTAAEGSYTDARIIGVYGDTGPQGPQGPQGNPGTNGINTATVYLYQRAASAPNKPSSTLTYTFSTSTLSGTLGDWKQSIGELSGTNPIWVIAAVASSNGTTDTITSSEWSTQIKLAENGTDGQPGSQGPAGLNQATVYIYKRADSAGTISPATATYTFSSGDFTAPTGWSKTIPSTPAGKPCWVSSAVAIGNDTTATLTWNNPSVLVENGADGISPTVTSTSNGVKIVDANGNETYITNGANGTTYYTHVRYSANANGSNYVSTPTSSTIYIGVYSGTSSTAPAYNDSGWTWSKYVGDPGTPATQYYAFVKYATDANGSNMQDSPDSTHIYVGTYTGTNSSPTASLYQWSKYVGDNGQPATQYYAFIKYATNSSGANMTDTPTTNTKYVGTYSGTKASPVASDYKWSIYVGSDGISVTQVRELYYLTTGNAPNKPTSSTTISDDDVVGAWTSVVPSYIVNGKYYLSLETTLSDNNNTTIFSDVVLDEATTTSNYNAYLALSISQNANENAQGAMSQAAAVQYATEALDAKLKQFFWPGDSSNNGIYRGAYAVSGIDNVALNEENISTYGFNVSLKPASVTIGYNAIKAVELEGGTPSLKFYVPSKTTQATNPSMVLTSSSLIFNKIGTANKAVELTNSALNFYGSSTSTADVTLSSDGLTITNGSVQLGTGGASGTSAGNVRLANVDFNRSINNTNRTNLRLAIGSNFGVKNDGTLYASNADISGKITVGGESNVYTKTEADGAFDVAGAAEGARTAANSYTDNKTANMATTTDIDKLKANYGVCTESAANQVKRVTCANFELVSGNELTIRFTYANTYYNGALQLNVNSTGAKNIWVSNAITSGSNQLLWGAGAFITFKYIEIDSSTSYFIPIGEPRTWYGSCSTAEATAIKTDNNTTTGCVICKGAKIELAMTNKNTATAPKLNVCGTGEKNIYYGTSTNAPTVANGHSWINDTTATFTFDGQYYRLVGQTVINADNITTGTIDANILTASSVVTDTLTMGTAGSTDYIYISKNDKTLSINGESGPWKLILGNTFGVTKAGYMSAASGKIGGWTINTAGLFKKTDEDNNGSKYVGLYATNVGSTDHVLTFAERTSGAWDWKTYVRGDGYFFSKTGQIAGFNFNSNALWKDSTNYRLLVGAYNNMGVDNGVILGVGYRASSTSTEFDYDHANRFYVTGTGKLYANNAVISGNITATSGSLDSLTATNLTINSGSIESSVTIGGKNQSEYLNSNVQIGGRNLLLNSGTEVSEATTTTSATMCTNYWAISGQGKVVLGRLPQSLIISFDAKSTTANVVFTPYLRTDTSSEIGYSGTGVTLTTGWVRYTVVLTKSSTNYSLTRMWPVKSGVSGATISIKNVKLESGSKATDWTPAPEDVDASINEKADKSAANQYEQQIYYRTQEAKTFADTDYPTTFITTTTNVYNQWTRKIPPLAASTASGETKYPYLYTCIQRKAVDGTLTNTAAALDANTTIIDGGTIITGTVTANKLNATNINASKTLTVGAFTDSTQTSILNSTYILDIDSNQGITIKPKNSSGNNYLQMNSSAIAFFRDNNTCMVLTDDTFRIGLAASGHATVTSSGLEVIGSNGSTSLAVFGADVRVGPTNKGHVTVSATGINIWDYDDSRATTTRIRTNISNTGVSIFDYSGTNIGQFGSDNGGYVRIGTNDGQHVATYSDGIRIRKDAYNYATVTSSGLEIYQGNSTASKSVAVFGSSTRVGATSTGHLEVTSNGMNIYDYNDSRTSNKTQLRVNISDSGLNVFYYVNDTTMTNVANFGWLDSNTGFITSRIGPLNGHHVDISSNATTFFTNSTTSIGNIQQTTVQIENTSVSNAIKIEANNALLLKRGSGEITIYDGRLNLSVSSRARFYLSSDNIHEAIFSVDYSDTSENNSAYISVHSGVGDGVKLGCSSSGTHGIYSDDWEKWIIYMTSTGGTATVPYVVLPTAAQRTTGNAANVYISDSGALYKSTSSSKRYKRDIENIQQADALYNVQVRQFKYRDDYLPIDDNRYNKIIPGFIVEELEKVYPIAVDYENDIPENWNVRYIIPGMLKLIQEQHAEIEQLKKEVDELRNK